MFLLILLVVLVIPTINAGGCTEEQGFAINCAPGYYCYYEEWEPQCNECPPDTFSAAGAVSCYEGRPGIFKNNNKLLLLIPSLQLLIYN